MKGVVQIVGANGLGDAMTRIHADYIAAKTGRTLYTVLHIEDGHRLPPGYEGWLNVPLYAILDAAGVMRKRFLASGLNQRTWLSPDARRLYTRLADQCYGEQIDEWVGISDDVELRRAEPAHPASCDGIREAFKFLEACVPPTVTVQLCSTNHGNQKRINNATLCGYIEKARKTYGAERVVFIGSRTDREFAQASASTVAMQLPGMLCENLCGCSLRESFAEIYNAAYHIGCESWASFFAALVKVPAVQVYHGEAALRDYGYYFGGLPWLERILEPRGGYEGKLFIPESESCDTTKQPA